MIAAAAWTSGAKPYVHLSALDSDPDKLRNFEAIRALHPGATIIGTSNVFGEEDNFTNYLGGLSRWPVVPVVAPRLRLQPVHVCDLAHAIVAAALEDKAHAGKRYEVAGPEAMTMRDFVTRVALLVGSKPILMEVPDKVTFSLRKLGVRLPGDHGLALDDLPSGELPGLDAFGLRPMPVEAIASTWLVRYRRSGRFGPHVVGSLRAMASRRPERC